MTMFLIILFCLTCLFLMLVILIQKPKGGGLSAAFGGGGGADSVFGGKTGDMLTWFTTGCFVLFLVLGVLLTYQIGGSVDNSSIVKPVGNSSTEGGMETDTDTNNGQESDVNENAGELEAEAEKTPTPEPSTDEGTSQQ